MKSLGKMFASTALVLIGATVVQTYPNSYAGEFGLALFMASIFGFLTVVFE